MGNCVKLMQGLIKGPTSLGYGKKPDASKVSFRTRNTIKHLLGSSYVCNGPMQI